MAITIDDFSKIWASTSPLTPYEFSENNYKSGWNFIGSTPPSRQMWDFLQKNNDEKMQYLANNYLPLSGGTMTGNITANKSDFEIQNVVSDNDGYISLRGGGSYANGASINAFGKNNTSNAGEFSLVANDGSNSKRLAGNPDGTLTWDGSNILTDKVTTIDNLSNIMSFSSGFSLRGGSITIIGKTASLRVGVNFINAVSANTTVSPFTLNNGYRPVNYAFIGGENQFGKISPDGSSSIKTYQSIDAGGWTWVTSTFLIQ